jgi:hypothetical protein
MVEEGPFPKSKGIDFAHYDSDKSARAPIRLPNDLGGVAAGGVFIYDDIQDNMGLR